MFLIVLAAEPQLHYYQGLHDVATVFLLVMCPKVDTLDLCSPSVQSAFKFTSKDKDEDPIQLVPVEYQTPTTEEARAYWCLCKTILHYLRPCANPDLHSVILYLSCLYPLLEEFCPELAVFLKKIGVEPFFALSWIICWCSHDLDNMDSQKRIFDFFLVSSPWMSLYFTAAVLIMNKQDILLLENDHSVVHSFISKLLKRSFERSGEEQGNKKRLADAMRATVKYYNTFDAEKLKQKCKVNDMFEPFPFTWMTFMTEIELQKKKKREMNIFILNAVIGLLLAVLVFMLIELYRYFS